jgi:hypothetical protein
MNNSRPIGFLLPLGCCFLALFSSAQAATLAGKPVQGGARVEIEFPVAKYFQDMAAQAGNPHVTIGRAVLLFPPGFDPSRTWPLLIVSSTSDFRRTNIMDTDWYRRPAMAEGFVVLGSDSTVSAHIDSTPWRLAFLAAALEAVRKDWPQSAKWPVVFAGFSGGAKRSGFMGSMLAHKVNLKGFFLSGINDDRLSVAYRDYHPGGNFLDTPIWISSGNLDPIATPALSDQVRLSLQRTGFKHVRLERFAGGHQLKMSEVRLALQWFRQLGNF